MSSLDDLNYGQLKKFYSDAYKQGDTSEIKGVLEFIEKSRPKELLSYLNNGFLYACVNGDLNLVKFYLTSNELNMHANINVGASVAEPIRMACKKGHLDVVKYLLTSPELSEHAYIDAKGFPFISACEENQLEIVKYFLNSPEMMDKINIDIIKTGIKFSCRSGKSDVFKYLLDTTSIRNENDFSSYMNDSFAWALEHKNIELLRYLVFDLDMDKNINIKKALKKYPNKEVNSWFELKSINKDLSNELIGNETKNNKKVKL